MSPDPLVKNLLLQTLPAEGTGDLLPAIQQRVRESRRKLLY
jgi:hypothetical protein